MQEVRERVLALAGQVIAGYRLERVLASGAADVMYLGRLVGKKPEPITRPGLAPLIFPELALIDLLPLQEQRAERAAKLQQCVPALQLLAHRGILPLLACGDDPVSGCVYTIYPYPAGGSLANRLSTAKGKPLPFSEVTTYLSEVAGALDVAHQQGYFHLHLTPSTILLDASGTAYLASIGIAQILELGASIANGSLYAAPEQIIHDPIGPTTDVYGLGMVLYQLVTGHTAFDSTRHQLQTPPPPSQYRPDLPAQIEEVILRAISSYPGQRYATAGFLSSEFALAIQKAEIQSSAKGINGEAPTAQVVQVPSKAAVVSSPKAPARKSFVVSPPQRGNTVYPPQPQPQWQLPQELAQQLTSTQGLESPPTDKVSSKKAQRKSRSWSISAVTGMITLVSVAILVVLIFPQLNHAISLPFVSSQRQDGGSISAATGASLYKTTTPGICDKEGASWAQNSESEQTCGASAMLLRAAACQDCPLAVVTFGGLPGQAAYPASYAVQVTVQPLATDSSVMFGLKFRQQSLQDEGQQRGGYSYLISQNGQWEFDKYGSDGSRQLVAQGKLHTALPPNAVLGLVVNGSTYTFYVNAELVATERDTSFSGGYLCLVAAPSATVLFSKFSLARVR